MSHTVFIASWFVVGFFAASLVLILLTFVQHYFRHLAEERHTRFLRIWQPILEESLTRELEHIPELSRGDFPLFLKTWNYYHDVVRGEPQTRLEAVASSLNLALSAKRLLRSSSYAHKLTAVVFLGNLKNRAYWGLLDGLVDEKDPVLSLAAAMGLVQIDPKAAMEPLALKIVARHEWSRVQVARLLKSAGRDAVSAPLSKAVAEADLLDLPRVLEFLKFVHPLSAIPAVESILARHQDPEIIGLCMHLLSDTRIPQASAVAERYLSYPVPQVRAEVAAAMAQIGDPKAQPNLALLLEDRENSVRLQAARAIASLASAHPEGIEKVAKEPSSLFLLSSAVSEREFLEAS